MFLYSFYSNVVYPKMYYYYLENIGHILYSDSAGCTFFYFLCFMALISMIYKSSSGYGMYQHGNLDIACDAKKRFSTSEPSEISSFCMCG